MGELKSLKAVADRELVRRLQAGDDGAVNDFARDYRPRIQQLALRYLKNAEDAEEVTQDVLLKAVVKIADFRGDAALSSWLYRVDVTPPTSASDEEPDRGARSSGNRGRPSQPGDSGLVGDG